jgi:uncharacterized protein YcbX
MLLISDASLEGLNAKLPEPIPMNRFRPNVTVSGCEPFAEDSWGSVVIGDGGGGEDGESSSEGAEGAEGAEGGQQTIPSGGVPCDFVKPCSRCTVTTAGLYTLRMQLTHSA